MKMLNQIDPFYLILRHVVLRGFLKCEMNESQRGDVMDNIHKHRNVLWMNVFTTACISWAMVKAPKENLPTLMTALVGPVMVFGAAWFAISFAAVPKKMQAVGNSTTFWMFTAFLSSLTTMFISVGFISPWQVWPVLGIVYWAGYLSCVQYDTADLLKAGLDEKMLLHAIAALKFYRQEHQITADEE